LSGGSCPITGANPGTWNVVVTNTDTGTGIGSNLFTVFDSSGLVGYWKFDEGSGTTATDSSGHNNTGTLINGPTWTTGKVGNALSFDGVDDYVSTLSNTSLSPSIATISVWIKPNATQSTNTRIINIQDTSGKNYDLSILQSSYKIDFVNWNGSYASVDLASTSAVPPNEWTHIVVVVGNQNNRLYINGVLEASSTSSSTQPGSSILSIGRHLTAGWYFNGFIDEVAIYNRALSTSEISVIYNAQK
jgi:hypothetical protein